MPCAALRMCCHVPTAAMIQTCRHGQQALSWLSSAVLCSAVHVSYGTIVPKRCQGSRVLPLVLCRSHTALVQALKMLPGSCSAV